MKAQYLLDYLKDLERQGEDLKELEIVVADQLGSGWDIKTIDHDSQTITISI